MRSLWVLLTVLSSAPAWAQYAPNSTGIGILAVPSNELLRLDEQFGVGLSGTRQIGVGSWSWTYRGMIAATTAIDDSARTTFLPAWISTGLRLDFLEDRFRPFVVASGTYYQLTNAPADFAAGTYMVGAGMRGGLEQFLASEISVQLDMGATWFLQLDAPDPITLDAVLVFKVHY